MLIKDNHIALAGGVKEAVSMAKQRVGHLHKIEVEVSHWAELREAIDAGADILLLDNQSPDEAAKLVEMARGLNPNVLLESSGGISLETVRANATGGPHPTGLLPRPAPESVEKPLGEWNTFDIIAAGDTLTLPLHLRTCWNTT